MADKKFNIIFDVNANVAPFKNAINQIQSALGNVNIPANFKKGIEGTLKKLSDEINNFEALSSKGFHNLAETNKAEKSLEKITTLFSKLGAQTKDLKGIDPQKFLPQETIKKVTDLQKSWFQLKKTIEDGNKVEIDAQTEELEKQQKAVNRLKDSYEDLKTKNKAIEDTKLALTGKIEDAQKKVEEIKKSMLELAAVKGGKSGPDYKELTNQLATQNAVIKQTTLALSRLDNEYEENKSKMGVYSDQIGETNKNIDSITAKIEELKNAAQQTPEGLNTLRQQLADFKNIDISEIPTDIDEIGQVINRLEPEQIEILVKQLREFAGEVDPAASSLNKLDTEMKNTASDASRLAAQTNEIEQFANRIKYFFSIGNTVMLFRRAIKSAIDTVKELDEVMTQAAVVTKFSVADMWAQLPEYSKRASELGVTIKGVYEASTLYYQQGLETNQVIGVANETLKMAKIAGIDYATATDYMTSALRGFNMEVNEMSAQKVNDIYSQLAAHTASNVEEISTAMSKTAPLARNAGMEIETTAALLAQMIERTREAPETLGTAMKTVIARFQELKKDPALIEPVEGEIVDANKVETALNTIGVALRDTSGQFRNLDEVFLEISEKWDTLSTNTQRYIATIAAGSRQQSRFIAMMADYKRTTELVTLANNAAGASSEQFAKTQESLESKLNRLKNAWNEFTMGLANNKVIKVVVDLLTSFINIINKLTKTLSFGSGLLKSFWDIGALLVGIRLGRAAFNGFFAWLLKTSKIEGLKAGTAAGTSFSSGIKTGLTSMKALFTKSFWTNVIPAPDLSEFKKNFDTQVKSLFDLDSVSSSADIAAAKALTMETEEYRAALARLGVQLPLNNSQQEVANLLAENGVTVGIANASAVSGLTKAEIAEKVAKLEATGATEQEISAELTDLAVKKSKLIAEGKLIAVERQGLLQKLKLIPALLFGTNAERQAAFTKLKYAGATVTATEAEKAFNASLFACPIGWIIAGIAALTIVIIALAKHLHDISLAGRMEAAAEQTQRAKEAADEAKRAYEDLLSDKSGYDETQQALKDLTYGTQEWKEKLVEANQQVLELIQKMPELAAYLKKGEFGQLTIDSVGWDKVIENQQKRYFSLTTASIESQNRERNLQLEAKDQEVGYSSAKRKIGNIFDEMESALLEGNGEAFEELGEKLSVSKERLEEIKNAIIEYNKALESSKIANEKSREAIFTSVLSSEKIEQLGSKAMNNLAESFAKNKDFGKDFSTNDFMANSNLRWNDDKTFNQLQEKYSEEIGKLGGISAGATNIKALRTLYAAMVGKTVDEVKEEFGQDAKKLREAIIDFANADEISEHIDQITDKYLELSKADKEIVNILTSEGDNYYEGVEALVDNLTSAGEVFVEELTGKTSEELLAELVELGNKQREAAIKALTDKNINIDDFGNGMDAGMIAGFSDHLLKIFESSGSQAAQIFGTKIQNAFNELNIKEPEKAKQFMTTLNSIDWKNANEVETLSDKLDDLGINLDDCGIDVDDLETQIKQLAKAAREVDLEKLTSQIRSLGQLAYDIGSGKQTNDFSEDQKNNLISEGIAKESDFVYDFETGNFKYLGGTMEDLRQGIIENTKAKVEEQKEAINDKITSAETAQNIINENPEDSDYALIMKYIQSGQSDKNMEWVQQVLKEAGSSENETFKEYANEIRGQANELPQLQDQKVAIDQQAIINELMVEYQDNLDELAIKAIDTSEDTEYAAKALKTLALNAGVTEKEMENLNAAEIAELATTYKTAKAHDINSDELREYANNLKATNKDLKSNQAAQVALANTLLNKGLKKVIDSYDDWTKLIDETSGKIKRSTSEDAKVYEELKDGVADLLNISPELSEKLLDNANNVDLVRQAAEGSTEALAELQKIAAQEYLLSIDTELKDDKAKAAIKEFADYLNSVDLPPLEPGIDLSDVWAGTSGFIEACNKMIQASKLTGDQVTALFDGLGFTTELTTITKSIDLVKNRETGTGALLDLTDEEFASISMPNITTTYTLPTVKIKSLKSNGSSGAGISNNISYAGGGSSGGGGSSSSSEEEKWENPYDWLYNLTQKINAELRTREKLERRYQRLLKTATGSGEDLKRITDEEIASLEKRRKYEQEMIDLRRQELKEYLAANAALAKYAQIDWELEVVRIDWNQINAVTDPEEGEAIEAYISKLEELLQSIKEAQDAIDDIDDDLLDIKERGRDDYRDLEDRVLDALISEQQDMIDEQERIYDAINDAASDLMDAISRNIEKIRQDRQNEETETSLAEKERRLAYLRQDTTGSNALEIKKLEQELDKEKQNYTDQLIDQGLNDLKEQNDYAAEQRDKQIELMQSTLDWQEQTGYWVDEATRIVREGIGEQGVMDENSRLYSLLAEQEGLIAKSNASQYEWNTDLSNKIANAFVWLKGALAAKESGANTPAQGDTPSQIIQKMRENSQQWWTANSKEEQNTLSYAQEQLKQDYISKTGDTIYKKDNGVWYHENGNRLYELDMTKAEVATNIVNKMKENEKTLSGSELQTANRFLADKIEILYNHEKTVTQDGNGVWWVDGEQLYKKKFKRGGLADFTGPAWLDGTKSNPELVLNAKDTENFLQLKDILSNLRMSFNGSGSALGGDWYFDIDINVGEIANDYDVDQLTERVKQSIYTESTYRNVNAINFLK